MLPRRLREIFWGVPYSFRFFAATAIVFALQLIPYVGIFLMFAMAMFWSVILINVGMIGTAIEALLGRVSRMWLLLPLAYFGGFWTIVVLDHAALSGLSKAYGEHNALQSVSFDAARQSLVLETVEDSVAIIQHYDLQAAYSLDDSGRGFRLAKIAEHVACREAKRHSMSATAQDRGYFFYFGNNWWQQDFHRCALTTPAKPPLPQVRVSNRELKIRSGTLPVTRIETTIAMPDGTHAVTFSGYAAPLKWLPMPAIGCGLIASTGSWECAVEFLRDNFMPIVPKDIRFGPNVTALAKALGLKPLADASH